MVSIVTDTGIEWCGNPNDFDWTTILGKGWTWLSHNAAFDAAIYKKLHSKHGMPEEWLCTANMAAFLSFPRDLKGALKVGLDIDISKGTRDNMAGKRWEDMTDEFKEEVLEYALDDSRYCLQLYQRYAKHWPEQERWISNHTIEMGWRGVPINVDQVKEHIKTVQTEKWRATNRLPWSKDDDIPTLSKKALAVECRAIGLEPPTSIARDSDECAEWIKENGVKAPWVADMQAIRRANTLEKKLVAMDNRIDMERKWMPYELKYFGGHTGRDSGAGGVNMQNLPRGGLLGVDIRHLIQAPKGYTFISADLSQIEPRVLAWISGDTPLLENIAKTDDLYEAQARAWGFFDGDKSLKEADPGLRHEIKQLNLGLGYGMGATRFADETGKSVDDAQRMVNKYRADNHMVVKLWKELERDIKKAARNNEPYWMIDLPSGRKQFYRNPSTYGGLHATIVRTGGLMQTKLFGGRLAENLVQAVARDVFMYGVRKIEESGIQVLMRVHDEVLCLSKEEDAEENLKTVIGCMEERPKWALKLPLQSEGFITNKYTK
jgi:DNA polymerase